MKRSLALLLPLVLVACQDAAENPVAPSPDAANLGSVNLSRVPLTATPDEVVPGEIIVKFRNPAQVNAEGFARGRGLGLKKMGYEARFAVLSGTRGREIANASALAADPQVEYAEPNYLRHPTDCQLWAFNNPGGCTIVFQNDSQGRDGQTVTSFISTADADEDASGSDVAGGYGAGGSQVFVGSIDTGVDFTHQEFASGQLVAGKDWVNNDNDPSDDDSHGTHTTGTMAGSTVGVAGASGAGSNVRVYVQKVCGPAGCPTTAIVDAIYAAADYPNLVAMNLSLGGTFESKAEKDAINYAVNTKGVLVIASAGNDGTNRIACPACDVNSISVAAINWQGGLAYYSQYGSGLDISAPGGEQYSNTSPESGIYSSVPGGYAYYQGTSMAAPQVTGTAGVVASKTGLRGSALRQRIESTADDVGASGYDTTFGNGRLNSYAAVIGTGGGPTPPPPSPCVPKGKGKNCK